MKAHHPLVYKIGNQRIRVLPGVGLNRVITDFRLGLLDVLTVVTDTGAWRIFSDGSTYGDRPSCVDLPDLWIAETPTKPDIPTPSKKPV